jgi:hypothetical protein
MQGKGGIGKTLAASYLGQFYLDNNRPVTCYDADPVNASLSAITALSARPVKLFNGDQIDVASIDQLIAEFIAAPNDVIVDNGASGFVPFSRYLIENKIADILSANSVDLVIHAIVAGGGMTLDTLKGLNTIFTSYPASVKVVIWINEFFGPVAVDGMELEQMQIYRNNRDRILGIVQLEKLNAASFGHNVLDMLDRKLTFSEAMLHPSFTVVPKQRLAMVRRSIYDQVGALV